MEPMVQQEEDKPKTYTQQRGEACEIWKWKYDNSDIDENALLDVLGVLSQEFRSFGEGLVAIMEAKLGFKVASPAIDLECACQRTGVDLDLIGTRNTLNAWFENVHRNNPQSSVASRPRKSEKSRTAMFAFAFAMELTAEETHELFRKVYLDRAYNQRDYKELIYYYCLSRRLSFSKAQKLIEKVHFGEPDEVSDKTVLTQHLADTGLKSESDEALIEFIQAHNHNFMINTRSAMQVMCELKEKAREIVRNEGENERTKYKPRKLITDEYTEKKTVYEDAVQEDLVDNPYLDSGNRNRNLNSNDYLYDSIIGLITRSVVGTTGTVTLPIKNSLFPREIRNRFPQPGTLGKKNMSSEELRKVIILLFSYCFWKKKYCDDYEWRYNLYVKEMDDWLTKAKLPLMYYGNPYDWMFLFCTATNGPLEAFKSLLDEALGEQDDE